MKVKTRHIPINLTEKEQERFTDNVNILGEDECWLWTGFVDSNTGNGKFAIYRNGKRVRIHVPRIAYYMEKNDPGELLVCHSCLPANDLCCNPKHLFLGNREESRANTTSRGLDPKGEDKTFAKLTDDDVREIRFRYLDGESSATIARDFGISTGTASVINNGGSWKHVK